jgi:hypothetical protein
MTPIILESTWRLEPVWLVAACILLAAAVAALLVWLPIARRRAWDRGAAAAEPALRQRLVVAEAHIEAARVAMRELRQELVALKDANATMRGRAADLAARAMGLVTAHEEPRDGRIIRMGGVG